MRDGNGTRCRWVALALTGFAVMALAGLTPEAAAQEKPKEEQAQSACPDCAAKLDSSGWCDKCGQGVAKGLKTKCKSCLTAIGSDGWCADCKVGYVGGQKTTCKACYAAMTSADGEWCADCKVGYAKGVKTKCQGCLGALQRDGWCPDCKVGYVAGKKTSCKGCHGLMASAEGGWCPDCNVGHAKGLKTKCKSCFAAIQADGSCKDCGVRFAAGRSFKKVALHMKGLDADGAEKKVRDALAAHSGVSGVQVDTKTGWVNFELETTKGAVAADVVAVLKKGGFEAHEKGTEGE